MEQFDLLVLGSGSSAFAAAIKASELGASVAMTEDRQVGGTCVNRGCIPSKNLIHAAGLWHTGDHGSFPGLGIRQEGLDFHRLVEQKDELVEELREKKYFQVVEEDDRIAILPGRARFVEPRVVEVGEEGVTARCFLIATGARTRVVPIEGLDSVPYLTSDLLTSGEPAELWELPESLAIIGGGFIACELGQTFRRLGSRVTLLERGPQLLRGFDQEVAEHLKTILEDEGVTIRLQAQAVRVRAEGAGVLVEARVDGRSEAIGAERLLLATGVVPNTENLGLELPGIQLDGNGFVKVDDQMRTNATCIWAAGDVTGLPLATPVGAREGVVAAWNMFGDGPPKRMDYRAIPRAVFTEPEVASVGLTSDQATAQGYEPEANCLDLAHLPKAAAIRRTRGVVKMVIDKKSRKILGVHLVADRGADIIHEATLAVKFGLTVEDLVETIHVYPTMSEAIRMAAQTFIKDVSRLSCCAE